MTNSSARKWLGLYFLLASTGLGLFLLLFTGSAILPLNAADGSAAFQILLPVFVGQMTVIFRWIAGIGNNAKDENAECSIPGWAVRIPPILAVAIVAFAACALAAANAPDSSLKTSPETFKASVTFAVTILNATTVYLVTKLFPGEHKN